MENEKTAERVTSDLIRIFKSICYRENDNSYSFQLGLKAGMMYMVYFYDYHLWLTLCEIEQKYIQERLEKKKG